MIEQLETDAERNAWLASQIEGEHRESPAGWHFIKGFLENPYGWYLKYLRGFRPKFTKPALTMGACIHIATHASLLTEESAFVLHAFKQSLLARKHEYEFEKDYLKDLDDGQVMLAKWLQVYQASDRATYDTLEAEQQHTVSLPNGFNITVRMDWVARERRGGRLAVFDRKTTRYSVPKAYEAFEGQDQSTCYLWALSQLYPKHQILGAIPDIMYRRGGKAEAQRPGIVQRASWYIAQWQLMVIGILTEMAQKVAAWQSGEYPVAMLFARNGKDESYFSNEWPGIFRTHIPDDPDYVPMGYVRDEWQLEATTNTLKEVPMQETGDNQE